jgi:hypothetical protein
VYKSHNNRPATQRIYSTISVIRPCASPIPMLMCSNVNYERYRSILQFFTNPLLVQVIEGVNTGRVTHRFRSVFHTIKETSSLAVVSFKGTGSRSSITFKLSSHARMSHFHLICTIIQYVSWYWNVLICLHFFRTQNFVCF